MSLVCMYARASERYVGTLSGLARTAFRNASRKAKRPALVYLFAEPGRVAAGGIARHREEIAAFAEAVAGDEVSFHASSYREWLATFPAEARDHAAAVLSRFTP